jgi:hypothetical protein
VVGVAGAPQLRSGCMAKKHTLVDQARNDGGRCAHDLAAAHAPDRESFPERYAGLRSVGYRDPEIANQMGLSLASLQRLIYRYSR